MKYGIHKEHPVDEGGILETCETGWRLSNGVGQVVWFDNQYVTSLVRAMRLAAFQKGIE